MVELKPFLIEFQLSLFLLSVSLRGGMRVGLGVNGLGTVNSMARPVLARNPRPGHGRPGTNQARLEVLIVPARQARPRSPAAQVVPCAGPTRLDDHADRHDCPWRRPSGHLRICGFLFYYFIF